MIPTDIAASVRSVVAPFANSIGWAGIDSSRGFSCYFGLPVNNNGTVKHRSKKCAVPLLYIMSRFVSYTLLDGVYQELIAEGLEILLLSNSAVSVSYVRSGIHTIEPSGEE